MSALPEPKGTSTILFEAGELLREEAREIAATLKAFADNSPPGDWATAARLIGRGDVQWPVLLIESLGNIQRWRLKEAEIERIKKYIAQQRSARCPI